MDPGRAGLDRIDDGVGRAPDYVAEILGIEPFAKRWTHQICELRRYYFALLAHQRTVPLTP